MSNETERRILEDLDKSGYTLEVDVLNWLMKRSWKVYPQFFYLDKQTGKARTIDMVTSPLDLPINKSPILILECKSSKDKPWIFFTPPPVTTEHHGKIFSINESIFKSLLSMGNHLVRHHPEYKKLAGPDIKRLTLSKEISWATHYFNKELKKSFSCYIPFRKNREDSIDDFKQALYQINSACLGSKFAQDVPVFLCIVFRGEMYALDENKHLSPVEHIAFVNLDIVNNEDSPPALVDVVKDTYFMEYLDILEKDMRLCIGELDEKQAKG